MINMLLGAKAIQARKIIEIYNLARGSGSVPIEAVTAYAE
jgi:hypothetical protein